MVKVNLSGNKLFIPKFVREALGIDKPNSTIVLDLEKENGKYFAKITKYKVERRLLQISECE